MTGDVLVRPIPYGFNSYVSEWLDVLKRIDALNPRIIAPGMANRNSTANIFA